MTTRIVLVPGFWLGAWAWDEVVPALRAQGHDVAPLTLPGLDPEATDRGTVSLTDHADAIIAALDQPAVRRVLVVHSGAAMPGTMVLDRRPDLVDHVVYVDTAPAACGFALNADLVGDEFAIDAAWDDEYADGSMRDLTDEQLATFRERAVAQPAETVRGRVVLTDDRRTTIPGTVICTSFPSAEFRAGASNGVPFLAGLLDYPQLKYVDLPTGHWPMWSKPDDLAVLIGRAAER